MRIVYYCASFPRTNAEPGQERVGGCLHVLGSKLVVGEQRAIGEDGARGAGQAGGDDMGRLAVSRSPAQREAPAMGEGLERVKPGYGLALLCGAMPELDQKSTADWVGLLAAPQNQSGQRP